MARIKLFPPRLPSRFFDPLDALESAGKQLNKLGKKVDHDFRWDVARPVLKQFGLEFYPRNPKERAKANARVDKILAKHPFGADQQKTLRDIYGAGVSKMDLWYGSHVVIEDGGKLAKAWSKRATVHTRTSSHYPGSRRTQYEMEFTPVGALLFGTTPKGQTFFQMEKRPFAGDLFNQAMHGVDFLLHVASGHMNLGPMGFSPHSEKLHQELHLKPAASK